MLRSAASPDTRGVRPVRGRCEWPPQDTALDRPPSLDASRTHPFPVEKAKGRPTGRPDRRSRCVRGYLIFDSRNSTCFLATGSYFFFTSLSVMVREFFLVT